MSYAGFPQFSFASLNRVIRDIVFTELGRTTLGSANATIAVTGLANKKWIIVLAHLLPTAALVPWIRINNVSTGTPYADRNSSNGGADTTNVSQNQIIAAQSSGNDQFLVFFIENVAANEKLVQGHSVDRNTAGAGTATQRQETIGKWAETTTTINEIDLVASTSTFASGSEVVVLGADPSDTAVPVFFSETGRTTLASTSSNIQTTITAKKYNLITAYLDPTASLQPYLRLNNVSTGTPYADRNSVNNGVDATNVSANQITIGESIATPQFLTAFFMAKSTTEKIIIGHTIGQNTAGAGNAPSRRESVGKWAETTSTVTEVDLVPSTSTFASGTEVVVYGSD